MSLFQKNTNHFHVILPHTAPVFGCFHLDATTKSQQPPLPEID